ncbi:MAG: hypothetical protein HC927_09970, partial [Deltaproteobacteria bacterium]|nr:hypothetical protein [Deltaproteobacteria bacterium]
MPRSRSPRRRLSHSGAEPRLSHSGAEPRLSLQRPLERAIGQGHPWIYRDALAGELPEPGVVVTVLDRQGRFLARGLAERGPIGVRVFTTRDR